MNHSVPITLVASAAVFLSGCKSREEKKSPPPSIILIVADDMGYSDLGCYGQKLIHTPNLDHMAAEGIRFTQMYAGTSVSAPSRCVLMTGLHTGHCFVRGNKEADPYGQIALPDSVVTTAELLKTAGYKTGLFGKWGLGVENTEGDPQGQGFDDFYGYYCQVHAHNSFPEYLYRNGKKEKLRNEVVYMPKDSWTRGLGGYATKKIDYSNDLIVDEAMRFIEYYKDQPFFLNLTITIPHTNGEAPAGEMWEVPSLAPYENEPWSREEKAYAALITRLDTYVGRIMAYLKESGRDKNTLILFTSDNGAEKKDIFESNGILRGIKRDLYEGGLRVPCIAWWPGTIPAGDTTHHISAFQDFLPTFCELAGVKVPFKTDGISFVPTLNKKEEQKEHPYLYWEFHEQGGKQAVRKGSWKAVRNQADQDPSNPLELYNLGKDPSEDQNVAPDHPELVAEMEEFMQNSRFPSEEFPFGKEKARK